ncbi:MAG: glycoside hydrolase [bacterium]|nr:glycoside hydrolase [bacterium]
MSLKKRYLKSKPVGKITFRLPQDVASADDRVALVGDFNDWNPGATPMKRLQSGEFTVTLDLETGREYAFRYLIGDENWTNDVDADRHEPSGFPDAENSVVVV